jgi:hypothetical protein
MHQESAETGMNTSDMVHSEVLGSGLRLSSGILNTKQHNVSEIGGITPVIEVSSEDRNRSSFQNIVFSCI